MQLNPKGNITTWASSSADGHSCFTWAKEKLRNLKDDRLIIKEDTLDRWIGHATSRRLPGKGCFVITGASVT